MPRRIWKLVISTRVEPPLPVSRLRGRGELLEIASADLRFSIDDAHTLLVAHQGLALGPSDVQRLVERTEGWPAGLYLAALSLRGREDPQPSSSTRSPETTATSSTT